MTVLPAMLLIPKKRHTKFNKVFLTYLCYYNSSINNSSARSARSFSTAVANALSICIIAGSTRTNGPPRPILSERVTSYVESSISARRTGAGSESQPAAQPSSHKVSILQAKDLPLLERPHFTYPMSQVPENLKEMHSVLQSADAYIAITPEYNHSPCPGLMNIMNHFGSSTFGFKPSAIVSYSAGQWGGTRAAHSLRPFLSELGCLPVSAMVHIPKVEEVLDSKGRIIHEMDAERWDGYFDRMFAQLEWWGEAAKVHRKVVDPHELSPAFAKSPSQRNAP